jgi:hypothetical protein
LRHQLSPLWLSVNLEKSPLSGVERHAVIEALRSLRGGMREGDSSDFHGALLIPPGTEFTDVLVSLSAQMEEVRTKLVAAGLDEESEPRQS